MLAIAIPALGSLVAEPLYLLVDSAIVGHLGPQELAALGVAAPTLLLIVGLCVFLAYATTTAVARATDDRERTELGVQGFWLGAAVGALAMVGLLAFAGPIARLMGGEGETAELAARYLRFAAPGLAAQLFAIAGQGWLRGEQRLGDALRLVIAAQLVNLAATVTLVYGFDLGLDGAAIGTTIAQLSFAGATLALVVRDVRGRGLSARPQPALLRSMTQFGGLILVRSAALSGSYALLAALAARISDPAVGAHHVAIQLLWLCALALDALAIAGQVLIAEAVGKGDAQQVRAVAARTIAWSCGWAAVLGGVLALLGPHLVLSVFTSDPQVADAAAEFWPWFCAVQVLGGAAFAFDGILLGLEDGAILAISMVVAAAAMLVALVILGGTTLAALWTAVIVLFAARTITLGVRAVTGPLRALPSAGP